MPARTLALATLLMLLTACNELLEIRPPDDAIWMPDAASPIGSPSSVADEDGGQDD